MSIAGAATKVTRVKAAGGTYLVGGSVRIPDAQAALTPAPCNLDPLPLGTLGSNRLNRADGKEPADAETPTSPDIGR